MERTGAPENSNKFIAKRERERLLKEQSYLAMKKCKINVYMCLLRNKEKARPPTQE
jgi:hypothetical protein